MAKKVLLQDLNNVEILPITRGELVLDSSGKKAFHSSEFLATTSLPGLMSAEDKHKLDNYAGDDTTYNLVSVTADGLAPKIGNSAELITTQEDEWVLTTTKGETPSWRKLPISAFSNAQVANSKDDDGYVLKGSGQANKVWQTDPDGNPAWRDASLHKHTTEDIALLTGYTKGTEAADLATTDTLNVALGKLEYKADTAYDWYKSITGTDNDDIINKWEEIVDFVDSVKEGADITDEFVTRKTAQTIIGAKTFSGGITLDCGLNINSTNPITWNDGTYHQRIQTTDDSTTNTAVFAFQQSADTGSSWTDLFTIKDNGHVVANKFITIGGASSDFVKGDGSLDSTKYLTNADLSNYVTLTTPQTITGLKLFNNEIQVYTNNYGVRLIGANEVGYLQLGLLFGEGTKVHKGIISGISGTNLESLTIQSKSSIFSGLITATKLITKDGTSSQFVKGDGSLDSNTYLPLAGGTMTGSTTVNSSVFPAFVLNNTNSSGVESGIRFEMRGSNKGYVGYHNSYGTYIWNSTAQRYICISDDGTGYLRSASTAYELIHSGNYTEYTVTKTGTGASGTWGINISGTAANADTLDNIDSTEFFISNKGSVSVPYIDLTTYTSNHSNYKNYDSGTYTVARSEYTDTYIVFRSSGSTSSIELMSNYNDTARLKLRKTIDSNRVSGPWRELAFTSDIPAVSNSNGYVPRLVSFPAHTYFGSSTITYNYLQNIVKWIYDNANYGDKTYLMGVGNPNGLGMMNIQLYGNSGKNSAGWPRYCSGTFLNLGESAFEIFGTNDYNYYYYRLSVDGHGHRITKLHRRDSSDDYSLQHHWTGSYWYLRGYYGDTYHAGVQVAYADSATSADVATTAGYITPLDSLGETGTVKAAKDWIVTLFTNIGYGIGANINVSESIISLWDNESASLYSSSGYAFIKIGGQYSGTTYGLWLLSSHGSTRVGYVGRSSDKWTKIYWLATTDDIPKVTNYYWANVKISDQSSTATSPTFANATTTELLTVSTGGSHCGIKAGSTYINSINSDLILQNNGAIRFGTDSWDYNCWAGLKYVHSSKTISLGLADGTHFTANTAQSGGTMQFPGINKFLLNGVVHVKSGSPGQFDDGIRLYGSAKESAWSNINFGCDPSAASGTHAKQWMIGRNTSNNFMIGAGSTYANTQFEIDPSGNIDIKGTTTAKGSIYTIQPSTNRRVGIIGTYDPNRAAAIWSMGSLYQIAADGTTLGNLYGAAYVYYGSGYTFGAGKSEGHSFVWAQNGSPTVALGNNVWTSGHVETGGYLTFGIYGALFTSDIRSSWRTSIYGDTANKSRLRTVRTNVTIADFSEIYGSGLTWTTSDTQGYLSVSYSSGKAWIGGGNDDKLNWSTYLVTGKNIGSQSVNYATSAGVATTAGYANQAGSADYADIAGGCSYGTFGNAATKSYTSTVSSTSDALITSSGVDAAIAKYLPLTGGTLYNSSNMNPLSINSASGESGIKFLIAYANKGWFGYNASYGVGIYNYTRGKYLNYKDDGTLLFEGNEVLHSGNWSKYITIPTKTSQLTNDSGFITSRGYIGTTAVKSSSTAGQNITGIGNITPNTTKVSYLGNSSLYWKEVTANVFRSYGGSSTWAAFYLNSSGNTVFENSSGAFYINSKSLASLKAASNLVILGSGTAAFYPNTTLTLGTSSLRWSYVYATHLNAEGGSFYTDANGAYWTSDIRLKTNIIKARNLDIADLLVEFDWKDSGNHSWGYIAQELLEVLPEAVSYNSDTDRYAVNYNVAHSAAIASLTARIKELEEKLKKYGIL